MGDFFDLLDDARLPPAPSPIATDEDDEDDEDEPAEAEGIHGGVHVDIVEALLMIEEELGKELPNKALEKAKTVGALIDAYERLRVNANRQRIVQLVRTTLSAVFGVPIQEITESTRLDELG